jgi:hypothetical protein
VLLKRDLEGGVLLKRDLEGGAGGGLGDRGMKMGLGKRVIDKSRGGRLGVSSRWGGLGDRGMKMRPYKERSVYL